MLLKIIAERISKTSLLGFVDSASEKWGECVSEYDVQPPSFLTFPSETKIVVAIGSTEVQNEVRSELKARGAREDQILLW